ncbi:multicopper oxidase family protein [Sphaerisporangium perillae]|uniref:multicopper oxidase family protein n=1 Tax=Sphaerisporangium perillae TaxID=2935860 RepID=UPI00200E3648|nr:multicopper oxidase family protein [Sphaerisporangium perillae]
MTVATLMTLDLLAGVLAAVAWLGAGALAASRRARPAAAVFAVAVLVSLARAGIVWALAGAGWWFVQEKITLTLPLLAVGTVAATLIAGPHLVRAALPGRQAPAPSRGAAGGAEPEPVAGAGAQPGVVVPLLGAGYAAAVGPVITLLLGYPATWSTVAITVALVATAVLVTYRIMSPGVPVPGMRVTVATTTVVGLAGVGLAFLPSEGVDTGGVPVAAHMTAGLHGASHAMAAGATRHHTTAADASGPGQPVTALRGPAVPSPGGTVRRFELTARTAMVTLSSGQRVSAWTFNGTVPGPPITAAEGDLIEVRLRNADIEGGVTLHWHGYDVLAGEDGVPGLTQDSVRPGQEFVYRFLANQVGTYWYHTHEVSDQGVKMGLYGTLVVSPRAARSPAGTRDSTRPPNTTDATQPPSSTGAARAVGVDLVLPVHTFAGRTVLGDHDQPIDRRAAPGTPVRLRLINTDNTPHRFTLAGTPYRLVAVDGTDLSGPGEVSRVGLRLPAGGRYDLAFSMPRDRAVVLAADDRVTGLRLTPGDPLDSTSNESSGPETGSEDGVADAAGWPELDLTRYGTAARTPFTSAGPFDRDFTLVLDQGLALADGLPAYAHTVNGRAFPSVPTQLVGDGDLVRMTVVNRGRETHPWHLHGHRVLVLSRDGRAPTGSPLWLDTFDVRPGEVWQVAFRAANPGLWMNHCHNLSHADQGMVLHLAYQGITTPFHGAHGG